MATKIPVKSLEVVLTTEDIRLLVNSICARRRELERFKEIWPESEHWRADDEIADILKLGNRLFELYKDTIAEAAADNAAK